MLLLRSLLLQRFLAIVWRDAPKQLVARAVLTAFEGLSPLLAIYLTRAAIEQIATGAAASAQQTPPLIVLFGAIAAIGACAMLVRGAVQWVDETLKHKVADSVLRLLYAQSIAVDLSHYESPTHQDTLHRAQQEALYRPNEILSSVVASAKEAVALASLASLMVATDRVVAIAFLLSQIPSVGVRLSFVRRFHERRRDDTALEREFWHSHYVLTLGSYAKEIRLFGIGPLFASRCMNFRSQLLHRRLRLTNRRNFFELLAGMLSGTIQLAAAFYVAREAVNGVIGFGALVMYYQTFQQMNTSIQAISGSAARLYESALFLDNLFEFLDLRPRIKERIGALSLRRPLEKGIVFEDVHFSYGGREVLCGVSLTIKPGEHVALVGANGAGKSTIVKLLARLYEPSQGRITIDGIDLRDLKLDELRQSISVIFQDHVRYSLTARENVWLGDIRIEPSDERIAAALSAAGAEAVVAQLSEGYETRLGPSFKNGEELSGGNWQKIALARAFFRDAQIMILDEPTSAFDAKSEHEVFRRFYDLARDRAAVIVSHRFANVQAATRIYVLADGRVAECGTHAELLALGGNYACGYELQASRYRQNFNAAESTETSQLRCEEMKR